MIGLSRTVSGYRPRADRNGKLREELRELAAKKPKYGLPMLFALLRRRGWQVNHKRVERLYRLENLALRRKKRAKRIVREREQLPVPTCPNEHWAMDFIHDYLADGTAMRVLSVVDCFTRECVGFIPARRFRADDVAAHLSRIGASRGLPPVIQCDNGTEFTSVALDHWAYWNHVQLDFSRPGKPTDNAAIESFHNSVRRECLTQHYFMNLTEADDLIERYRWDYNNDRPHSSLGNVPPAHFRAGLATTASAKSTA